MADTKEILNCPACGGVMKKVYMSEAGVNLDICLDGCGGIVFDNREFEKFDEPHESIEKILEEIKGKTFKPVNTSEVRVCPVCGVPMVKHGTGINGLEVDYCNYCAVKFLDNGELTKLRENPSKGLDKNIIDLLNYVYEENFDKVTFGMAPKKGSPRREFVENIVREILFRK